MRPGWGVRSVGNDSEKSQRYALESADKGLVVAETVAISNIK